MSSREKYTSIELLRIIAMVMIIIGHLIGHTHILNILPKNSLNHYVISALQVMCYPATNLFVLISGYLLCDKRFKIKRIITIWLQVFLYSIVGYVVGLIIFKEFSLSSLIKAILPISGDQYWFARVYFGLYFFMPFLNLLIAQMEKKQHELLLVICVVVFSLWRSFIPFAVTLNSEGGNGILWFFTLYFFGAYIRKYGCSVKQYNIHPIFFSFLFVVFAYASRIGIGVVSNRLGIGDKGTSLFTEFTAFPILFAAVSILIWADKKKFMGGVQRYLGFPLVHSACI